MNSNPVVWFEIYVNDMPRAKAFYEAMLGVQLQKLDSPDASIEMWAFPMQQPNAAGASGALAKMAGVSPGSGTIVYFTSEDCAVETGRVASNGGKVIRDKTSIGPHGFISILNDTEGNVVGIHSMK